MTARPVAFGTADLTNCEREQIHIPGSIQPHGCLLALESGDLRIVQAAGPTQALLGEPPETLLGARFRDWIGPRLTAVLNGAEGAPTPGRRLLTMELDGATGPLVCETVAHYADGLLILELEPAVADGGQNADTFGLVQEMVADVRQTQSVADFLAAMVERVRAVSGFDRVMLYRFLSDGVGSVEAEARADDVESYLGLRYPASDIPAQARDLYLRSTLRLIPDARYTPAPLVAIADWPAGKPLDLSQSGLRSVSPLHLEYLANMGVAASMSISIVIDGRLWGLIACHHRSPRYLPARVRMALDLFGQMASYQLESRVAADDFAERRRGQALHETLVRDLTGEADVLDRLGRSARKLIEYLPASGFALWIDGKFAAIGDAPAEADVRGLVAWLNASGTSGLYHSDRLAEAHAPAGAFTAVASGMLAISVSRSPRDYLMWFRPETIQTVRWGGDPNKAVSVEPDGVRLSPRKSFAAWTELVRGRSEPWSVGDIKMAESLRVSLLEVVLEHVDQLARERQQARVQQDALLAQLDQRIAQWEETAAQLKEESDRRAILEAELSQVLRRTVLEQEAERQRIARELHDSLGQYLTAMQLDLEGIVRDAGVTSSIRERVDRLKSLTAEAGHEVNHLAWEIRPTALDDLGLQTAIQQLIEEWSERSGLSFDVHLTLHGRRLNPAIESVLYRVLQEAILNVIKHAGSSRVGVILEGTETEVRLIVEDNGKGFAMADPRALQGPSARLGLLGVRERLALVGGSLEVESAPGQGTTLLIHVPL